MMKQTVDENWWMSIFDEIYLQTDARSVCDDRLTHEEVSFLEAGLKLRKGLQILDLCGGQGRHALELSRRGFNHVTVFDYSDYLLSEGNKIAVRDNQPVFFVRGDARHAGLKDAAFDFIMLMGSSFGYFIQENENRKILIEAFRLLAPKGTVLLDLPDKNYVIKNFKPSASHKTQDQLKVVRERKLDQNIIYCREKVMHADGSCIRDNVYCTRLYSQESIHDLLKGIGFDTIRFITDFMRREELGDYGCMTNRMIVLADKG
jgi:D-alanine-D-alanine ligase